LWIACRASACFNRKVIIGLVRLNVCTKFIGVLLAGGAPAPQQQRVLLAGESPAPQLRRGFVMQATRLHYNVCAIAIATFCSAPAHAQSYPSKPIRIVTSGVGGAGDVTSRLIAQGIAPLLGQQVIVDNRASGPIPVDVALKAAADGYTLLLYGSTVWLGPFLRSNAPDPLREFAPITLAATAPNILVVHPSLPVKNVKELIALAKARPGALNYATTGIGSSPHLAAELFQAMAGVQFVRISYKGAGAALTDLIGGQVQLTFATASSVTPHLKSGRLRALGVSSPRPSVLLPGLTTIAAAGLPGYESQSLQGVFAPAGVPLAILQRLNQDIVRFLHSAEAKEKFLLVGVETAGTTPEQFTESMKTEMSRMGKVIRDAGIRED
jgi:tripartite-type tricarboxylate transporter receptor subunit TctC